MDKMPVDKIEHTDLLRKPELHQYILETSVYPREAEVLKQLRDASVASHPMSFIATSPDSGQLLALLLKLVNAKKTIELGVFTGYSLLLTALAIPEDGKVVGVDPDRKAYEIGLPFIKKAGVEHKIDFIESPGLPVLDKLLADPAQEGSFDLAYVDADKNNYWNYHERLIKLVKVGGLIIYDNTLWKGTVATAEEHVPEHLRPYRLTTIEFNKQMSKDARVEIAQVSIGDGSTICRVL